jgi:ribose 5-phosphate isomerase A
LNEIRRYSFDDTQAQSAKLRHATDGSLFVTDDGLNIIDVQLNLFHNVLETQTGLQLIPGVIEVGLFWDIAQLALIGNADGTVREVRPVHFV